jgi:polar amino acid transport system permease protein
MHALHQVLHAFFNLHSFTLAMPDVWAGFQVNLKMMVIAEVLVLVFALAIAIVRGLPGRGARPLRALAIVYTDFFRGTPIIIVAFFVGFGIPGLQLGYISSRSPITYGVITLTLVYTAYVTEVYRAGIESVHASQRAAARSLGLSYAQTMRYVIIPQAVRRVIPPLLNDFVGLQKDTAIVYVIGVTEAASLAPQFSTTNGDFPSYLVAAVFFILITIPLARFTDHLVAKRELLERAQAF